MPKIASPPGLEVDGDAANAAVHGTNNDLTRKRITTTPATVAGATSRRGRHTEPYTTKKHNSDNTHWRSTEPPMQKRNIDDLIQQGAEEGVIRSAPLSLPTFSLAHQGHFSRSSGIPFWTMELNHRAALTAITGEEEDAFVCRIKIQICDTAQSCTGLCRMPIAYMNSGLAEYYRTHVNHGEPFELGDICDRETLSGLVRLGKVTDEDHNSGTYTCEAEFGSFEADISWVAEAYVPKKHVPGYKLVDREGEQNAVASIEPSQIETKLRHLVEFSRHIEYDREQMSVTFWSNDGNDHALETVAQILAYEFDGPIIYLEFRMRQCEDSWWHFHGRMNRELKHGRFTASTWPVPNLQSDGKFGMDWTDRIIGCDTSRRLQKLVECTKSYRSNSKEQYCSCLEQNRAAFSPRNSEG